MFQRERVAKSFSLFFLDEVELTLGHAGDVAFFANTPNDEGVPFTLKTMGEGSLLDGFFDGGVLKLDHFATFGALEMIVLGVAIIVFVEGSGSEFEFSEKASIDKFIEGAISGGPADFKASGLHIRNKGFCIEVIMVAEDKANHISLLASEALGFITCDQVFLEFVFWRLGYDNRLQIHG